MSAITHIFFDLDGTLYPHDNGIWAAISSRMETYIATHFGVPRPDIPALRQRYLRDYGTTLRGLQFTYVVDRDDYLAYVHDLPLADLLAPDPALRTMLIDLPQSKYIFTNADFQHAERVLNALGIQDCFLGTLDVRAMNFANKPQPEVYQQVLAFAGHPAPTACMFVEDTPGNLTPARQLGFTTVLVGTLDPHPGAEFVIPAIHDLAALPCLA